MWNMLSIFIGVEQVEHNFFEKSFGKNQKKVLASNDLLQTCMLTGLISKERNLLGFFPHTIGCSLNKPNIMKLDENHGMSLFVGHSP